MIVSNRAQFARMAQSLGWQMACLLIWDIFVISAYRILHWEWVASQHIPLSLYGSAIGIVVAFRNNLAYSRWWEARTLWGQIVNNSRSLARLVCEIPPAGSQMAASQRQIVEYQIAFVHALRDQLRGLDPMVPVRQLLSRSEAEALAGQRNLPLALQKRIGAVLAEAICRGWIDRHRWWSIDATLRDLMASQGGSERIKNTPLPKQYDTFPMLIVRIYCLLLPVGMVGGLGWFTPLGSSLVGFIFLALDAIGRNLEDPFDNTVHDVPLTAISNTIEVDLRQIAGETNVPDRRAAELGILW